MQFDIGGQIRHYTKLNLPTGPVVPCAPLAVGADYRTVRGIVARCRPLWDGDAVSPESWNRPATNR